MKKNKKQNIIITSIIVLVLIVSLFGAIKSKVFESALPDESYGIFNRMTSTGGVISTRINEDCYSKLDINAYDAMRTTKSECTRDINSLFPARTGVKECYYLLTDDEIEDLEPAHASLIGNDYVYRNFDVCDDAYVIRAPPISEEDIFKIIVEDGLIKPFVQDGIVGDRCVTDSDCRSGLECVSEDFGQGVTIISCQEPEQEQSLGKEGEVCYADGHSTISTPVCGSGLKCVSFGGEFGKCESSEDSMFDDDGLLVDYGCYFPSGTGKTCVVQLCGEEESKIKTEENCLDSLNGTAPTNEELQSACETLDCKESQICVLNAAKEPICKDFSLTCDNVICGEGFVCNINNDKAQCVEEQSPFNPTNIFIILVILLVLLTIFVLVRRK